MAANGAEPVEVPPVVDKALKEVVAKLGFKKPHFSVTSGSGARDGYLSTLYRANIHDEDAAGAKDVSVMCKVSMPSIQKTLTGNVFAAEGHIYSKVLPAMEAAAGPGATPPWPRVLQVSVDGPPPHCVSLEDFKPLGFGPAPERSKGLDADHCRLVAKQLAKFHAAGFVLKHLQPDKFKALMAPLQNLFDSEGMLEICGPFLKSMKQLPGLLTERWPEDSKVYKVMKKAAESNVKYIGLMVEPRIWENDGEGCCVAHGDCQINNMAFKYDKDTGRVTDCLLYDFQIAHLGSPTLDLTRVLLVHTDKDVRDAHLDDILRGYLRDLHAHMRAGGIQDPESVYSWDLLQKHFKRTAVFAVLMLPMFHSVLHADDSHIAKLREAMTGAGDQDAETMHVTPLLKSRFIDIVQDVADRGWLPTEEDIDKWVAGEA